MTIEQALQLRKFAIDWITKVIAKRKDYHEKLIRIVDDIIPQDISEECDTYCVLSCVDWDSGVNNFYGFGDLLDEYWDGFYFTVFTQKVKNDIACAFRIGIDLHIEQSGGITGFTVGDLRKVFDNNIPEFIQEYYPGINEAKNSDSIWL